MKKIIHLNDPSQDFSLCGDSDDGVLLDEVPAIAKDSEVVTCPRCLQIIAHCIKYASQHSVERTQSRRAQKPSSRVRKNKKVLPESQSG